MSRLMVLDEKQSYVPLIPFLEKHWPVTGTLYVMWGDQHGTLELGIREVKLTFFPLVAEVPIRDVAQAVGSASAHRNENGGWKVELLLPTNLQQLLDRLRALEKLDPPKEKPRKVPPPDAVDKFIEDIAKLRSELLGIPEDI